MKQFISWQNVVVFVTAVVLASASSVFAVWADPTDVPPNANTSAPLNVGAATQTKTGGLWAASVGSDNGFCIGVDCITSWADTLSDNSVVTTMITNNAVTTEKTDFVGTLQEGRWCSVSGGEIVCTNDAPVTGSVSGTVTGGGYKSCSDSSGGTTTCSCGGLWGVASCGSGSSISCPFGTTRRGNTGGGHPQLCVTN